MMVFVNSFSSTAWLQEKVNNKDPGFIDSIARRLIRLYP